MKLFNKHVIACISAVLCLAVVALGCETYGQSAGLGAGVGAGLGAIIGNQSGHAGEGALIGGVLGAMTGLIVKDIQVRRVKTAQETAAQYNYQPSQGLKLYPQESMVTPQTVSRGATVTESTEYAVLGAQPPVPVYEKKVLAREGKPLKVLSEKTEQRSDGTWVSAVEVKVPQNAQPGTYQIIHTITVPERNLTASRSTDFYVQ